MLLAIKNGSLNCISRAKALSICYDEESKIPHPKSMNRSLTIVVLILLVLVLPGYTLAQSPTPPPEGVILTEVSTTSQKGSQSESDEFNEDNPPPPTVTHDYGTDEPLEIDVSDPRSLRIMFGGAANALTPLAIQRAINPLQPKLFVSGHGRICTYKDGALEKEELIGTYTSEPIPELSETMQLSYQLGPLLGDKYSYKPNDEGTYDFNQFKPLLITGDPPPCSADLSGEEMESVTTKINPDSGFFGFVANVFFRITNFFGSLLIESKGELASAQTGTYGEAVERYTVAQEKGDVSYLPGEVQGETEKAGGALNTFFPKQLQQYVEGEEKPEGAQPNFVFKNQAIKTNDFAANLIEQAAIKTGCMLFPKELQDKFFESGKCKSTIPQAPTGAACGAEFDAMIASWNVADASCKICNAGSINSHVDVPIAGGELPPTMVKIIEKAADTFHVPASLILGTMYHEGGFSRTQIQWTEENVRKWSCGQELMPFCDEKATTAQLPLGWFPFYFDAAEGTQAFWNAVQTVDPTRNSREKTSPCNFMDVTFATAKALSLSSARVTADAGERGLTQCYSYSLTNRSIPQTCSAWSENLVAQSQVNYGGYCPEPGKHEIGPAYPDNNPFIEQTLNYFNTFSCGR
jgi:hypothetical protein